MLAGLAVEHVSPKSLAPKERNSWSNFLLGCVNCNSVKGDQETNSDTFLWPDRDNTFLAYRYTAGGTVEVAPGLSKDVAKQALRLMRLVGLDRHPGNSDAEPATRDKRYMDREEIWKTASQARQTLALSGEPQRTFLAQLASQLGCFSIWMSVFTNEAAFCLLLIEAFPGTARDCFDAQGAGRQRPNGRI